MKRDTGFVVMIVLIVLTVALLAASVKNEGCLPWQERVGREGASRCSGSWFPIGSPLLLVLQTPEWDGGPVSIATSPAILSSVATRRPGPPPHRGPAVPPLGGDV